MRILMLAPRFPYPPDRGDTLRSWTLLDGLSRRHEVWLACVDRRAPRAECLAPVRERCREVAVFTRSAPICLLRGALSMLARRSLTEGYFNDARLVQTIQHWSQSTPFDAVYTYSSSIAGMAAAARAGQRVLDMCDVDSLKWTVYARRSVPPLRWLYRSEAWRVAELERRTARAHDICVLVNERERGKFNERVPQVRIGIMPTSVPVDEYVPESSELPREPIVGMVGSMFYPPNVRAVNWFGRHVWPAIRRQVPDAQWLIVGGRPTRAVRRWAREPGVTVTGYVPLVQPYLHSMRVVVNAVDNDLGVQSKLVVAMAAGRPTVVTPHAAAGLVYDDPPPFIVSGSPPGFADAVVRLLRDDAQARALARRARAVAEEHYSAASAVRRLEAWLAGEEPPAARDASASAVRPVVASARNDRLHEVVTLD